MEIQINDISEVFLGVLKSRSLDSKSNIKYKIIESKDFDESGILKTKDELDYFSSKEILPESLILKKGDIIIKMFTPYTMYIVNDEFEGCIVPSNIAIIRQDKYPSNYLKQKISIASKNFLREVGGTWMVKPLSIKTLKETKINIDDNFDSILKKNKLIELNEKYKHLMNKKVNLLNKKILKIIGEDYE